MIEILVSGSRQHGIAGFCTFITVGQMFFQRAKACPVTVLAIYLRIVKEMFGYARLTDSTAFVTLPLPHLLRNKGCPNPLLALFWRTRMGVFG